MSFLCLQVYYTIRLSFLQEQNEKFFLFLQIEREGKHHRKLSNPDDNFTLDKLYSLWYNTQALEGAHIAE